MMGCHTPQSRHPLGADTPQEQTPPRSRHPQEQTPPLEQTHPPRQTATAADGTHPTGVHSCDLICFHSWSNEAHVLFYFRHTQTGADIKTTSAFARSTSQDEIDPNHDFISNLRFQIKKMSVFGLSSIFLSHKHNACAVFFNIVILVYLQCRANIIQRNQ